jgi:1-acyl-sn-glycerol-3-phosphate acyltransferase
MGKFSRFLGRSFYKMQGWKFTGEVPSVPKYICVLAPHTSIWDMIWGKMYNWATGMKPKIMVKKEFFFFPVGYMIKRWGAIPIDRKYPGGIVAQIVNEFKLNENMILAVTPEGTRAPNPNWKTGFYRISKEANVPMYISFIDFKSKRAGFFGEFKATDNIEQDMKAIKEMYRGMEGMHKGKFII